MKKYIAYCGLDCESCSVIREIKQEAGAILLAKKRL